jgi:Reverse transcriptase (RNA-dependent DNA polymerase)
MNVSTPSENPRYSQRWIVILATGSIPVRPEDREKTTFTSHEGLYWFLRMPFGLRNAPATFQRFVDITLSGLTWKTCLVYLDDIIVFSKTPTEHMAHLDAVLHRLYRAGLTLSLKKCHFFKGPVDYLGHVIRPGQLSVAEKNTATLKNTKHPTIQTELRSFLGLCNSYRRFVRGFAKIAAPLNLLLRKGETPQLGPLSPEQVTAFDTLRDALLNPPILALPLVSRALSHSTPMPRIANSGVVSSRSNPTDHNASLANGVAD